jgi:hypothetical protein
VTVTRIVVRGLALLLLGTASITSAQDRPASAEPAQQPQTVTPPAQGKAPPPAEAPQPPQTAPAPQATVPPQSPPPAPAEKPPLFTFGFHGFAGLTLYVQDAQTRVAPGQLAMWAFPQQSAIGGKQPGTDKLVFNGDVRQTRLNFSAAGPQIWYGATPKAVVEIDFAGGFGNGNFGDISLTPRLRLGYVEVDWGKHRLLFGQQNDLTVAFVSYSLSHLAFPLSFASGLVGWRRPGIFGYHTVAGDRSSTWLELAYEIGAPHWAIGVANIGNQVGTPGNPGTDRFGFNNGEASGIPAFQGRVTLGQGSNYQVYAAGHWNRIDRNGVDSTGGPFSPKDLDVVALQVGARAVVGPLTIQGQGFTGKNLAELTGAFLQFQTNNINDIHEYGGYVQAGFNFTPEWSVWGMIGTDKINQADAFAAHAALATYGVVQNVVGQAFVQYRLGAFALSLEWTHFYTKTLGANGTNVAPALNANLSANQGAFNVMYFF